MTAVGDRGAQAIFIGNRKRAMHRAAKRIPQDIRVVCWRLDQFYLRMADSLAAAMFCGEQKK